MLNIAELVGASALIGGAAGFVAGALANSRVQTDTKAFVAKAEAVMKTAEGLIAHFTAKSTTAVPTGPDAPAGPAPAAS